MANQVKSITSESLEAAYRALTPSQSGFTQDLQASNTIIPVLDLSSAAAGTTTSQNLQTALAFGSQTPFEIIGTTTDIATTPGFYRVVGVLNVVDNGANVGGGFTMTDGTTIKQIWAGIGAGSSTRENTTFDLTFFVASGITLTGFTDTTGGVLAGSIRQIADVNGTLVNPSGFTPQ